ncbi:MAG: RNA polymerase sigma-70 factor, partial [Flavobacteriales bacterium]|nr:RNA polymerase sigma-70 factor [Flavobacteriales bacterium]
VVQALFIELWERRNEIRLENPGPSYLFRAVRNRSLNVLKHEKVKREYAADSVRTTETAIHIQPETADLNSRIEKAMMKLPEQCRLVFRMSRFEELKYAEIAEKLGISIKTVENQMGKALRIMREELKDYLPLLALFMAGFID